MVAMTAPATSSAWVIGAKGAIPEFILVPSRQACNPLASNIAGVEPGVDARTQPELTQPSRSDRLLLGRPDQQPRCRPRHCPAGRFLCGTLSGLHTITYFLPTS